MKNFIVKILVALGLLSLSALGVLYAEPFQKDSSIESGEARLQSLIGTKPTIKKIHELFGEPDVTYDGQTDFKSELYYGKVSSKVDLVVYQMNDGSIRVLYVQKK